jgi:uncharacterized membrane protein YcgQ (UPF0703/DUF1980 family)
MLKKTALALALATVVTSTSALAQGFDRSDGTPESVWGMRNMAMMKMIDKDKDGQVSKTEFMKMMEESFAKMDTNGDGFVNQWDWLGLQRN